MPFTKGHKLINGGNTGHRASPESRRRMSDSHRGKLLGNQHRKGKVPWNKGLHTGLAPWRGKKRPPMSPEWKAKAVAVLSRYRGHNAGSHHSYASKMKSRQSHLRRVALGLHNNYKGGITPLVLQIRHCFLYRQWRSDIFTRDDFTCVFCGTRGGALEADHYPKRFAEIFNHYKPKTLAEALACAEFWDLNNERTLCRECHAKTRRKH
jgi:5-methylcytosine-specific restriction endonuclease McrA